MRIWSSIKCDRCGVYPEERPDEDFYEIFVKSVWSFFETPMRITYLCKQCYVETMSVAHGNSAEKRIPEGGKQ